MQKSRKYIIWLWTLLVGPIAAVFLIVFLASLGVFGALPKVDELLNPKNSLATVVYSGDMKILGKYYSENRVNVNFNQLDEDIVKALIATEDARFYEHNGVDIRALLRAVTGVIRSGNQGGGSTISQQLAKMMFPRKKRNKLQTALIKVKEWIIASRLEKLY
ncbi:MAG: transglycosylase domain-containing protein, partial [Bacteroidia bacterium]|nr:transglycosylase domain-containing protein [Bacteroidia bacterium]